MTLTTLVGIIIAATPATTPTQTVQQPTYNTENIAIVENMEIDPYITYFEDLIPENSTVYNVTDQNYVEYVEHRNGENIVLYEVHEVPENMEANGINYEGEEVQPGDKVLTVFVYNPETNYTDDIIERIDIIIE